MARTVGVLNDDEGRRPVKDLVELVETEWYNRGVVSGASSKVSFVNQSATKVGATRSLRHGQLTPSRSELFPLSMLGSIAPVLPSKPVCPDTMGLKLSRYVFLRRDNTNESQYLNRCVAQL